MNFPVSTPANAIEMGAEKETSVRNRRETGIALITALLVLLLMSTMIAGLSWLVMSDQKLNGNNDDRQLAFYGAEAGMEQLTASLENLFNATYKPNFAQINALKAAPGPPTNIPGVQYLAPGSTSNGSGYLILAAPDASNPAIPASAFGTISSGPYAGLVGLTTPYTLQVTAHTAYGSEVKLQREVQTVGIPVFQFGIFSQTDLAFFAGPNFNFGGRVHTNGNLWLAEGNGSTLTMSNKVTAVGQIITANLENGWLTSSNYNGTVDITTGPGFANLKTQSPNQSVTGTSNYYGNVSSYNPAFATMASGVYNGNVQVGATGATTLNLAIATPSIGGQPIDLIRRPVTGEGGSNPAKLAERYYAQPGMSLRILLSDYGPSGTCSDSDISSTSPTALPDLSANIAAPVTPIDLATLAWNGLGGASGPPSANGNTILPYSAPPTWLTNVGTGVFPLPASGATSVTYSSVNGYWVKQWYPIITGCIKIDYQTTAGGAWVDVTPTILNLGYTGRDINPQGGLGYVNPPSEPALPGSQVKASGPTANGGVLTVGCTDPSPNAIIRLARVRDNPSWTSTGGCPAPPTALNSQTGTDYWPNVLFDTREALLQDPSNPLTNSELPLAGAMYYVELDVANLASWLQANAGVIDHRTGYAVYFSDRRADRPDPNPPASVGTTPMLTGGFGWEDNVNFVAGASSVNGCPNGTLDQGEDVESDYNANGTSQNTLTTPRTYGGTPLFDNLVNAPTKVVPLVTLNSASAVLTANPRCPGQGKTWPLALASNPQDLRENAPVLFRRALKIDDGSTINLGTCNSVPCGLTIVSENPVYLQGDYNNPGLNTNFSGTGVGASVVADAVTLLSDNWNDVNSFAFPYLSVSNKRAAKTTTYRLAIAAGKGIPFLNSSGTIYQDFGTDGGTHNFLRFLENWGGQTLYYRGSIVSMYYSHQAVGTYKCCQNVYGAPSRGYQFDTNFLTPALLPPLTPMLRTINTVGFTQTILPTE